LRKRPLAPENRRPKCTKGHGVRCIVAPIRAVGSSAPDLEHALRGLDPVAGAPSRYERARERGVEELDRQASLSTPRIYSWLFEQGDQQGKGHLNRNFKRPGVVT
jgi:hypothetical protein